MLLMSPKRDKADIQTLRVNLIKMTKVDIQKCWIKKHY